MHKPITTQRNNYIPYTNNIPKYRQSYIKKSSHTIKTEPHKHNETNKDTPRYIMTYITTHITN